MMSDNSEGGPSGQARVSPTSRVVLVLVVGGALFALMWTFLPAWDFLVRPVAPAVRNEVTEAMEAATDPAERADLRLRLADVEQQDAARRTGLRTGIATLLAGSVAAWGAVTAWRQLQDNRLQVEAARQETEEQLRIARDGQITERFTRAVDQLGNDDDNLDVRLGGIYALERIARDSEADLPTVVEVLAAFVRGHSTRPDADDLGGLISDLLDDLGGLIRRAADVQAALTVLGRMEHRPASVFVDLSATDLVGANLREAHLEGANLREAHLEGADLREAHLEDANLHFAHLERADLREAHLERAKLLFAHLEGADLREARLEGANLQGAHLERADLREARLERANLQADLQGAFLVRAHLERAFLLEADLEAADLREARLERANLQGAHLERANFQGADLQGADLTSTKADGNTRWPDGFDPETAGVIFVDRDESAGADQVSDQ